MKHLVTHAITIIIANNNYLSGVVYFKYILFCSCRMAVILRKGLQL